MTSEDYDIAIVGGGIAGCSLAHALSTLPYPLRIALIERSLAPPVRIVGELLQPGGIAFLKQLGLGWTLEGIDAVPVKGYCTVANGKPIRMPYPPGVEGCSFHHSGFVMRLREAAKKAESVTVIEATVTGLLEDPAEVVRGVRITRRGDADGAERVAEDIRAKLVIVADGPFSSLRNTVIKSDFKPIPKSHFVGIELKDFELPFEKHGTVVLSKDTGPVLLYDLSETETRVLIDIPHPQPKDVRAYVQNTVIPCMPPNLQAALLKALPTDPLRRMVNQFLPGVPQHDASFTKQNILLIGDSWNMRHGVTGGGMSVALQDVVILRTLLKRPDGPELLQNWRKFRQCIFGPWYNQRKGLAASVNLLSVLMYDLFGADAPELAVLRLGFAKYLELGGEAINGPVRIMSALSPSVLVLFGHLLAVAVYSIYDMFRTSGKGKFIENIHTTSKIVKTSVAIFTPAVYAELRWWLPTWSGIVEIIILGVIGTLMLRM